MSSSPELAELGEAIKGKMYPEEKPKEEREAFEPKTTEEMIEDLKRLGRAGAEGIKKLRGLFETVKEKLARREIEKLEKEIKELEETKKRELEKAGLLEEKRRLEKELAELKKVA